LSFFILIKHYLIFILFISPLEPIHNLFFRLYLSLTLSEQGRNGRALTLKFVKSLLFFLVVLLKAWNLVLIIVLKLLNLSSLFLQVLSKIDIQRFHVFEFIFEVLKLFWRHLFGWYDSFYVSVYSLELSLGSLFLIPNSSHVLINILTFMY